MNEIFSDATLVAPLLQPYISTPSSSPRRRSTGGVAHACAMTALVLSLWIFFPVFCVRDHRARLAASCMKYSSSKNRCPLLPRVKSESTSREGPTWRRAGEEGRGRMERGGLACRPFRARRGRGCTPACPSSPPGPAAQLTGELISECG
jgi:hypothetical protein